MTSLTGLKSLGTLGKAGRQASTWIPEFHASLPGDDSDVRCEVCDGKKDGIE